MLIATFVMLLRRLSLCIAPFVHSKFAQHLGFGRVLPVGAVSCTPLYSYTLNLHTCVAAISALAVCILWKICISVSARTSGDAAVTAAGYAARVAGA
jgi:hypothetical protein